MTSPLTLNNTKPPSAGWRASMASRMVRPGRGQAAAAASHPECRVDDEARAAWRDPLQYRREQLPTDAPAHAVLNAIGHHATWRQRLPAGQARGLAVAGTPGRMSAQVVEVRCDAQGQRQLARCTIVMECSPQALGEATRHEIRLWAAASLELLQRGWGAVPISIHLLPGDTAEAASPCSPHRESLGAAVMNALNALQAQQPLAPGRWCRR